MRTQFTRSSRKHKIGRARAFHVITNNDPTITVNDQGEEVHEWTGLDDRGIELEIAGFVVDDGETLLVVHVMPTRYRGNEKE
ncbi:MAG: hypothetical protein QM621_08160 [Aeromicrobium sp.]|uniref:hypothetical protein n=1 Tax=Aeromicrobium sp. TaxID=1871063 RepID=UPI0039E26AF5